LKSLAIIFQEGSSVDQVDEDITRLFSSLPMNLNSLTVQSMLSETDSNVARSSAYEHFVAAYERSTLPASLKTIIYEDEQSIMNLSVVEPHITSYI
jgi:hypothetical protein